MNIGNVYSKMPALNIIQSLNPVDEMPSTTNSIKIGPDERFFYKHNANVYSSIQR